MTVDNLPYRPNVGALIFNRQGRVFVARRTDSPSDKNSIWQCPQGGIDPGEEPQQALLREVEEETGLARGLTVLGRYPTLLRYDLPPHLIGKALGGKYRGQEQYWFALRYVGDDNTVKLNAAGPKEFDAWKWLPLEQLPKINQLKGAIYEKLARFFQDYARGS